MACTRTFSLVSLTTIAALWLGCGDDGGSNSDARIAASIDAQGGPDAPVSQADATSADATPAADADTTDADTTDADPAAPDATTCPTGCPSPAGSTTATTGATGELIIESINIARGRIVLRNLASAQKTITNWFLCFGPGAYFEILNAAVVPASGTLTLVVGNSACGGRTGDEVCVNGIFNIGNSDEFGLFETDTYSPPATAANHIRAYLRWGVSDAATDAVRQEAASLAGLWPALAGSDDFIPLCGTHDGFVATGDVTDATGFTSVDASCF